MQNTRIGAFLGVFVPLIIGILVLIISPWESEASNMNFYTDTISESAPSTYANHTLTFTLNTDITAGGYLNVVPPTGFEIRSTDFEERNVELYVNGTPRTASSTLSATLDQVIITSGSPGSIRYNLNTSAGLSSSDQIEMRIGNHTSNSLHGETVGSTTFPIDLEGIKNSSATGTHEVIVTSGGGTENAYADFVIAVIESVGVGPADTTETIPPFRFNGAPTSTIGGTTLNVEISLETDEFAICKYDTVADTAYGAMPNTFEATGLIVHSQVVSVTADTDYIFYVRCIDDEGNFNIDDYLIAFSTYAIPTGTPADGGNVEGSGSGTGDSGTGSGTGSGGTSGSSDGGSGTTPGSSSGGGGSGGGGGGSSGSDNQDQSGGGFENADGPYRSGDARVIISGYAFPGSKVYALVDGFVADTVNSSNDGKYLLEVNDIARGVYTFGAYAIDSNGIKSTTFSTSFTVTGGRTSELSNINIMPSILVEPDPVDPGQTLTVSGFSIPNADIIIENESDKSSVSLKTFNATSDSGGEWSITIDTSSFKIGTYKIRAKAEQTDGLAIKTDYSDYTYYGVGQDADVPLNADLNLDGSINLTDFSILLFWWGGGDGGNSNPPADINRDGKVQLTDFSIMLFQWTG